MKRTVVIFIMIFFALSLFGCKSAIEKREANLSELRDEVLVGGDESVKITLSSGIRENPFVIDGTPSLERTEFSVVIVEGDFGGEEELSYTLRSGEKTYEGKLTKHPFKDSYSVEISEKTLSFAAFTLSGHNFAGNYELKSVKTEETITATEAVEIAEERLKNSIKKFSDGGKINAELYVRLIKNPISAEEGYFWYVAYAPEKYTVYAVLINSSSRDIVAVRE
jgi:hypothetical protein